jgi:hypothetical protein
MDTSFALAEGAAARAAASKCTGQAPKLVASSSIPSGPDRPSAAWSRSVAARPPVGPAFSGAYHVNTRQPGREHPITTPATAAAKTCLRRRKARLPGIICKRLQITAVRGGRSRLRLGRGHVADLADRYMDPVGPTG